jgi:type I restriction enzyme S subunit
MIEDLKPYPAYKDSGVPWLGEVPEHWDTVPLCAIATPKKIIGKSHRELLSVYLNRGVIRFAEVQEKRTNVTSEDLSKYQAVDPGDFVLNNQQAWRGSVGVSKYKGIVSPAYLVLSLDSQINTDYANRLFRDRAMVTQYLISSKGVGSIQRNLYWPYLKRVPTLLPPPAEQAAIVRYLDYMDRRIRRYIRAKQKLIKLLEEQKQSIIHQAVTGQIDVRTGQPYPAYKPSGVEWLGEVPEHWDERPAKYRFREVDERSLTGDEELLSVSHITGVTPRSQKNITMFMAESYIGHKLCQPGDLVINTMWAWMGAMGVANQTGIVSSSYAVYRPIHDNTFLPEFIDQLLRVQGYVSEYICRSTGIRSSRLRLYPEKFLGIPVVCPPLEEQKGIVNYLRETTRQLANSISVIQREIDLLREYHTSLIADVVTGKLDVRQAAAGLPAEVVEPELLDEDDDIDADDAIADDLEEEIEEEAA